MKECAEETGKIALAFHFSSSISHVPLATPEQLLSEIKMVMEAFCNKLVVSIFFRTFFSVWHPRSCYFLYL